MAATRLKVLFFVEGFTDIRFVTGLAGICELTMAVPAIAYRESGLKDRVAASGVQVALHEIAGGRLTYQWQSFRWLWRHAPEFDVILSQEVLRGSLNATLIGAIRRVPVVTYMAIAPLEYFLCRRQRQQIGALAAWAGSVFIRSAMTINGLLATRSLALGAYLCDVASRYSRRTGLVRYYGVDIDTFVPANDDERRTLRRRWDLPADRFIIFLASRISHEKDPETVLLATAYAREHGLDAVLMNLGGGYRDFLALAAQLNLHDADQWVIGRPAAHPMTEVADYFRAVDAVAQASLEEGLGLSPLEALACGTPVVATAVGGMAVQLPGVARLTAKRDHVAMGEQLLWIAANRDAARAQALRGRDLVISEWSRTKAFDELAVLLNEAATA